MHWRAVGFFLTDCSYMARSFTLLLHIVEARRAETAYGGEPAAQLTRLSRKDAERFLIPQVAGRTLNSFHQSLWST